MAIYINRERPHDADKKRREYALNKAHFYNSKRGEFIDWCKLKGISNDEMVANLASLDYLAEVWQDVADQSKVD